jgi:dTMP kinase
MPLIVLEGLDGAGKSTQLRLLQARAAGLGHATEFMHFPRTETPLYGETIARFLRGDFGDHDKVDPYMVAMLFAGDRADAASTIRGWLNDGKYVFLDRYVYSNVGFQCAKIADPVKRRRLRDWILELEFEIFAITRPDLSLFLDVPFRFTESRLTSWRGGQDRSYLNGGRDIHEDSLDLQRRVREVYLDAAANDQTLKVVDCTGEDGAMLPPEKIFEKILNELGEKLRQ